MQNNLFFFKYSKKKKKKKSQLHGSKFGGRVVVVVWTVSLCNGKIISLVQNRTHTKVHILLHTVATFTGKTSTTEIEILQ